MPKEAPSITNTLASLSHKSSPAPLRIHFPSTGTVVSSPGQHLTKEATAPTPIYSVSASALSHLTFPNCDLSPCTSASTESSFNTTATNPPKARRESGISLYSDPDQPATPKYMVVSLNLDDAPFPLVPLMSPLLHGLQTDLTLATEDLDPDDEFIPLQPSSSAREVIHYMGTAPPPPPSSPHRYVFMLWEQPAGLTRERICDEMGIRIGTDRMGVSTGEEEGSHDDMGMLGKVRWDEEGFERRLGLERVVAANYFVC